MNQSKRNANSVVIVKVSIGLTAQIVELSMMSEEPNERPDYHWGRLAATSDKCIQCGKYPATFEEKYCCIVCADIYDGITDCKHPCNCEL